MDCQPRDSWLLGQEGFGARSWVGSHEGHVSRICVPSPDMNASKGCPIQGLEAKEGVVLERAR